MSTRCRRHSRLYCVATDCVAEQNKKDRTTYSHSTGADDGTPILGVNSEGNPTMKLGGGLTMDVTDGSIGFSTGGGFSIDTPSSSDY